MKRPLEISGLRFMLTSVACPEQYDVFKGDERVGYVRLRHGTLRVNCPECRAETVLEDYPDGDGAFTDEERPIWLARAAEATGYDTKILKQVIRIRKQDKAEREEQEAVLDLYLSALGMILVPRDEEDA